MEKVILVGGTSYSGSTMLDMILSNDDHAFSCGEVMNLFQPSKPHHINPKCGCGDDSCTIWSGAKAAGESKFIKEIFQSYPSTDTVVSSSKNVLWIYEQNKILREQGFDVRNVLTWKSPILFAYSMHKRGRYQYWERAWINYHTTYLNLISDFIVISYDALVTGEEALMRLCEQLDLKYFEGKRSYWNKKQHTLFGNTVTKYHQHAADSSTFKDYSDSLIEAYQYDKQHLNKDHQTIYQAVVPDEFRKIFTIKDKSTIEEIEECFRAAKLSDGLRCSGVHRLKLQLGYAVKKFLRSHRVLNTP